MKLYFTKFISVVILILISIRSIDSQGTTTATSVPPGCQSINQLSQSQSQSSGQSCNVSDSVLRVQCQTGNCQSYSWSLNACNQSCQNGGSGPSNSSSYICPSNCQTVSSPSSCNPPPTITPYMCGTTTTSTRPTTKTTGPSQSTPTSTKKPITTTKPTVSTKLTTNTKPVASTTSTSKGTTTSTSGTTSKTGTSPKPPTMSTPTTMMANCSVARLKDHLKANFCGSSLGIDCGNGQCVDFNGPKRLDCRNDCPNGVDEACFDGQMKCQTKSGCACVNASDASKCVNLLSVTIYPNCTSSSSTSSTTTSPRSSTSTTSGSSVSTSSTSSTSTTRGSSVSTTSTTPPTGSTKSTISPTVQPAKNCSVCQNRPECVCPPGYIGDGYDCVLDQCSNGILCKWNEICQGSWSKSNCQFRTSFICSCDPDIDCSSVSSSTSTSTSTSHSTGTVTTRNVTTPTATATTSSTSGSSVTKAPLSATTTIKPTVMPAKNCTVCKGPDCNCPQGNIGDGLDCLPDQCDTIICAWNEYCQGYWSKNNCQFSVSFVCLCDPDIGCESSTSSSSSVSGSTTSRGTATTSSPPAPVSDEVISGYVSRRPSTTTGTSPTQPTASDSPPSLEPDAPISGYVSRRPSTTTGTNPTQPTATDQYAASGYVSLRHSISSSSSSSSTGSTASPTATSKSSSSTSSSTSTSTTSKTTATSSTSSSTSPPSTPEQCVNRTILDAVVQGGCGHNDNVTRIVCGDGTCVLFDTAYMDCKRDCSDGIDEQCLPGYVLCDGCTCVSPEDVNAACSDTKSISTLNACRPFTIPPQFPASGYVSKRHTISSSSSSTSTSTSTSTTISTSSSPATVTSSSTVIRTFTPMKPNNCTVCHGTSCVCEEGFIGDGITCVVDQCANMRCAYNEYCQGTWSKSDTCQFTSKFECLCDPSIGCESIPSTVSNAPVSTSSTAPRTHPSLPPKNNCTVCHGSNCNCRAGYIGDGIDCAPDQCATMQCRWNEMCEGYWYKNEKCNFTTNFQCTCDPTLGCTETPGTASTASQPITCIASEFLCKTGHRKCIPCAWVEDKVTDCDNGEDEVAGAAFDSHCIRSTIAPISQYPASGMVTHRPSVPSTVQTVASSHGPCGNNFYTCQPDGQCIPCAWVGDKVKDCQNGDDESSAATSTCGVPSAPVTSRAPVSAACGSNSYTCPSGGQCVPCAWVGDHVNDCPNGEDELPQASQACPGASASPAVTGKASVTVACGSNSYTCPSTSQCVPCAWVNDHVNDCPSGEDELPQAQQSCSGGSQSSATTARTTDTCRDGKTTCQSNSQCVNKVDGTYQCVCNDHYYMSGGQCLLHPCYDTSQTPCDSHAWCDAGNSSTLASNSYTCHCILPYTGDGKTCPQQSSSQPPPCTSDQWKCPSDGTCIPTAWVLDHVRDCPNGDDEQAGLIDECKVGKANCDSHATCINIPSGGFNCTCQPPYYGNGFSCWQPSPQGNIIQRSRREVMGRGI